MAVGTCTIPPGVLSYREHSTAAGDQLTRDQVRHLYKGQTDFGKKVGDAPATAEYFLFTASAAGTIREFKAKIVETGSAASSTFDLKKYAVGGNSGSSVLSAAVTIANSDTDNTPKAGTINSADFVAGDSFYALCTMTTSTGAAGPSAWALFDEVSP
jgi:hypothetical protein